MKNTLLPWPWVRKLYWSNLVIAAFVIAAHIDDIRRHGADWKNWLSIYTLSFSFLVFGTMLIVDARRRRA